MSFEDQYVRSLLFFEIQLACEAVKSSFIVLVPVDSPYMVLKLQCFAVSLNNRNSICAYLRSTFENYACWPFCVFVKCCEMESINISMFGI